VTLFTVIYKPGPRWIAGRHFHEQNGVMHHRDFLAERHAAGDLVAGGPFLDDSGGLAIYETNSSETLKQLLSGDQSLESGLLTYEAHPCALPFFRAPVI
jgi:uncharacterized protein